jgi:peptide/nickel transport system substrate-binding protein
VQFIVVPDTTTRALELRKGSADIAINALTSDTTLALERDPKLEFLRAPGTVLAYIAFNLRDPILKNARVRQALAYSIDRRPLIHYLWRDFARPAARVGHTTLTSRSTISTLCGRASFWMPRDIPLPTGFVFTSP